MATTTQTQTFMSPETFLAHWHGHRGLTRRLIEVFPDDKLFTYSVGGMRPFSALALEMISMGGEGVKGLATGEWISYPESEKKYRATTKKELLDLWDSVTEQINTYWPQITPERFQEDDKAFGQWEGKVYWLIMYFFDNEIHHRGQGYVYLRGLGIEPPPFWDRKA